jgi:hypothetical protein
MCVFGDQSNLSHSKFDLPSLKASAVVKTMAGQDGKTRVGRSTCPQCLESRSITVQPFRFLADVHANPMLFAGRRVFDVH